MDDKFIPPKDTISMDVSLNLMILLIRTHSDLIMADNNSKLLNEMLDHFDRTTATAGERDLLKVDRV